VKQFGTLINITDCTVVLLVQAVV